jgi:excisionase family DNA binding protein
MQVEPIIPISRAARQAGIPVQTVRRLIDRGQCPFVVVGSTKRVRLSAVRSVIRESVAQPATA